MDKHQDLISKIEALTVVELAEVVKAMEEKFGIQAGAVAVAGAGAPAAEAKDTFDVFLKGVGDKKIEVIKVVREATALGLKEAKDMVDSAPKMIKQGLKKEEADELKKKFDAAGAVVEIQ